MTILTRYETACRALAEAVAIDEVKDIRDKAVAMAAYAQQAKDNTLLARAIELRERATQRLGQMIIEAKEARRLGPGQPPKTEEKNGDEREPFSRVTLQKLDLSKRLSVAAQRKARISERAFEAMIARMHRDAVAGISPDASLRNQEREHYRQGARNLARELSEASALKPCGRRFPVAYGDPAWKRKAGFSNRSYENHYNTMSWDDIIAMPVAQRLLPDAWGFIWIPRPHLLALHPTEMDTPLGRTKIEMPLIWAVANGWGFDSYSTCFIWTKTDEDNPEDHGSGLIVWDQDEILCLFKRGRGLPMPSGVEKVGSNHRERAGNHSAKPAFYRDMINRMTGGLPVLELFAREDDEHVLPPNFFTWGNQSRNTAEIVDHDSDGVVTEDEAA